MRKFVAATKNKGKLLEIKKILRGLSCEVISMEDAGITIDVEETGKTFEENAMLKASQVFSHINEIVIADDSGLEVDCLDGAPGVYTARFAGENATDDEKIRKLLDMMKDIPTDKRNARFVCAVAVMLPGDKGFTVRGTCEGVICNRPAGTNGFGYDPVFYIPEYDMTMAQMGEELKNSISHRGKALKLMLKRLSEVINEDIDYE